MTLSRGKRGAVRALICSAVLLALTCGNDRERQMRRRVAEEHRCNDSALIEQADSTRVDAALRTPATAWVFITAPDTRYADRLAAAQKLSLPASFLPRVVAARRELYHEFSIHQWGLKPDPSDSAGYEYDRWVPERGTTRTVLGYPFRVPSQRIDFPLTCEEESNAPWPWQASKVMVGAVFSVARAPAADYDHALLTLPCTSDDEALYVRQALFYRLQVGKDVASLTFMAVLRNLILRDRGLYGGLSDLRRIVEQSKDPSTALYAEVIVADAAKSYLPQFRSSVESVLPKSRAVPDAVAIARARDELEAIKQCASAPTP